MMTPLLEATDLVKTFTVKTSPFAPPRQLRAVDGVTLRVAPGETLGIAGESGCGKSTLGKLLLGLLPPDGGTISYNGQALTAGSRRERLTLRKNLQMIFQDPFSSLNPRMRVGDIIGEPLIIHQLVPKTALRDQVLQLMGKVGLLPEHLHRYPHEFSGGQRQRIGIARALAASPQLIVADEPVSALDLSIQAQIINLLQELKREFGLAYIFIAHDLSVVRHMSDRVAIMYLGKIVETGEREAIFSNFRHPYTEALLSAIPRIGGAADGRRIILQGDPPTPLNPPPGCPFHPRCPYAEQICSTIVPQLTEKGHGHLAACHFSEKLYSRG
ncbi:ABC transporter ATP-binding protein [Geotalea uraniireducens]|nr:dipeptide ABC transporter ATP-binding protein [Geotalea uraniireducens]